MNCGKREVFTLNKDFKPFATSAASFSLCLSVCLSVSLGLCLSHHKIEKYYLRCSEVKFLSFISKKSLRLQRIQLSLKHLLVHRLFYFSTTWWKKLYMNERMCWMLRPISHHRYRSCYRYTSMTFSSHTLPNNLFYLRFFLFLWTYSILVTQ